MVAINSGNYPAGSVAFGLNGDGSAQHAMLIGMSTTDNIYYFAHTNSRNGYDASGPGIAGYMQGFPVAIYSVNYGSR